MTREEQVLIRGKVFLYKQKAPFVPSGKSVLGALEYQETDDKVRCHECGEWFTSLGKHLHARHSLTTKEYRERHGLNRRSALCGPVFSSSIATRRQRPGVNRVHGFTSASTRAKGLASRASALSEGKLRRDYRATETRNANGTCQAQLAQLIKRIANGVGGTPTALQLRQGGVHPTSVMLAFNVTSLSAVMAMADLLPHSNKGENKGIYTASFLVESLRNFYVKFGRTPTHAEMKGPCGLIPRYPHFKREFGSMAEAYKAAGLYNVAQEAKGSRISNTKRAINQNLAVSAGRVSNP